MTNPSSVLNLADLPQPAAMHCPLAQRVVDFFHEIGLAVTFRADATGFIDHVAIEHGGLLVDPACPASALLHEGGHLSIVPSEFRHMLDGDIEESSGRIMAVARAGDLDPDGWLNRALIQMGDPEATAWAFAAGRHLGIPDESIIQDHEYDSDGDGQRLMLRTGRHYGINGLQHAGFCVVRPNPYRDLPAYPSLAFWLQR